MAIVLDGKKVAADIQAGVKAAVEALKAKGVTPKLTVLLVGDNPASAIYVRNKARSCEQVGMASEVVQLPATASHAELAAHVDALNADPGVDGILIQLPLPKGTDPFDLLCRIDPAKDVDGFHPRNVGLLQIGKAVLQPCTPAGIMRMLDAYGIPLEGRRAVVIGRSDIVGKPMAAMLLHRHCTVTLCHSRTRDLGAVTREADILVAAIGRAGLVTADMVKPGAVVVDVGMNTLTGAAEVERYFARDEAKLKTFREKGAVLMGDVDYHGVFPVAGHLTPVPGGVGPLTIAMLLQSCADAARARRGLD
jgi:methylenetetrahydrofolate dehydrogenase (NADP+)/methenyltetrahydrofolate cyclohydrolase